MDITGICPYETPCGWCTKWDKKCDMKIGCGNEKQPMGLRANIGMYDDYMNRDIIRKAIEQTCLYEDSMKKLKKIIEENQYEQLSNEQ